MINETQVSFFVLQIYNDKIKFQGPKGFCKAGIFSEQGMSLHSLWHSNYYTDSVSYQGRKCHIPVLSGITLLYGTSMQKIYLNIQKLKRRIKPVFGAYNESKDV